MFSASVCKFDLIRMSALKKRGMYFTKCNALVDLMGYTLSTCKLSFVYKVEVFYFKWVYGGLLAFSVILKSTSDSVSPILRVNKLAPDFNYI